jgi:hypothetical protein
MSIPNASPGVLAAAATKLIQVEFINDEDVSRFAELYREYWLAASAVGHTGVDNLYTALWHYDREHKRFGTTRAERVTRPLRGIPDHAQNAHRAAMQMVLKYRREYAEDIEMNSRKPKTAFRPGDKPKAA